MSRVLTVDVHCHLNPERYLRELVRIAEKRGNPESLPWFDQVGKKMLNDPRMWDPAARLAELEPAGVDVQVVSVSTPNVYVTKDPREALGLAQIVNDGIAEACYAYPGKYLGLAAVPLVKMKDAVDEIDRAIDGLCLSGLAIGDNVDGEPLTSPRLAPFWAEADRRGLAVVLHPMVPPGAEEMTEYDLVSTVGFAFDTTSDWLPTLRCAYETLGASQLVFGCDYPLGFRRAYTKTVIPALRSLGLSPDEEAMIFHRNALKLLRNVPAGLIANVGRGSGVSG